MDSVFPGEDIGEQLWSSAPMQLPHESKMMMNRSSSEWALQRFLQEADTTTPDHTLNRHTTNLTPANSTTPFCTDPPIESGQAFLKSRLDLACAAFALTRANCVKPQDPAASSSNLPPERGRSIDEVPLIRSGPELVGGVTPLPGVQKKPAAGVQVIRSTTSSGSSGEQSDDEGEAEITTHDDPTHDVKRVRRMLSNRESARRSRRRKQAHLTELETQVSQVRVENSSVLKRLTDISQKYNEAAVDNRVLKADVETLRAKVKMTEETVKRLTGLNPLFQAMSEISTMMMPSSFTGSPFDDAAVPEHDETSSHYYESSRSMPNHDPRMLRNGTMLDIPPMENVVQQHPATDAIGRNKIGRR